MINQNIIILGLEGAGSTYIVQSMRETIGHYYITVAPKTEEVYYNRYKLLSTKSNWYIHLHLPIEYQQFLKAFEFNESVWTILLIRKDFLDVYLTFLIRWHTNHTYIHMRSYSEKEILNWKRKLLLSKEQNPCAKPAGINKDLEFFSDKMIEKHLPNVLDFFLKSRATS